MNTFSVSAQYSVKLLLHFLHTLKYGLGLNVHTKDKQFSLVLISSVYI